MAEERNKLLSPISAAGMIELRKAIAKHLYSFRAMVVSPEQIIVGAGTEYLYSLIIQLLGRDNHFGLEDPGYQKLSYIYKVNDSKFSYIKLDDIGLSITELNNSDANILHISPTHHFPTGLTMPLKRRYEVLSWAAERENRFIIEDDYDSEFRFTGRPIPTLRSIDRSDRVIYMNTFSRTLAPSLRISYMVLPPALLEDYHRRLGFYSCTVPAMEQYTLARFLSGGGFETHVNRMRVFYRGRRDQVLSALEKSPLKGRYVVRGEDAGLHFLVGLDTRRNDRELARLAQEAGIRLSFLTDYGGGEEHWLVVNYPGADLERLPQALERLAVLL